MHLTIASIVSVIGLVSPLLAFVVIVTLAWRKSQTEEVRRALLIKLTRPSLPDLLLLLKRLIAGTIIAAFTVVTAIGLFALIALFPTITCHGGGSGGNCGEGYLASLPTALLTIPLDLVAAFLSANS
ncbi:hypothetical protein [Bradyrhizobium sp. BR 10289]|uniref:hypothetical protein n=1 Tax=Bradyrhizobium sp. BR 10289 TaxID=2749993 RepID=UPI001C6505F8|nr:hypothetical protein [Bradyrhizobium sp. BR 10289]MBW7969863.1 hypothetical protein [Bradyrhizobium sp. BR 10289]